MFSSPKLAVLAILAAQFAGIALSHPSSQRPAKRFTPLDLGLAKTFGAIAATTLTSTGDTLITGDCGTSPGTSITGFPPGKCTGTTSSAGTEAGNAEAAAGTAYNNARAAGPTTALTGADLGGLTLGPGVYTFPTSGVNLTGALTLDGSSNAKGQFIFLIETTFGSAAGAQVKLVNGAQACNVYFIVGSSATVGAASALQGNLIAYTSISVENGASNKGIFAALNGAVTLIDNALTAQPTCSF